MVEALLSGTGPILTPNLLLPMAELSYFNQGNKLMIPQTPKSYRRLRALQILQDMVGSLRCVKPFL